MGRVVSWMKTTVMLPSMESAIVLCWKIICVTIDFLKGKFDERVISRNGPVEWPPRSCDLTPLDFFVWGHIKSLVYADKSATLDDLKDNIQREIANVPVEMCSRVMENCSTESTAVNGRVVVIWPISNFVHKM